MAGTYYRVGDDSNFAVANWVYDNADPFARVDDWQPGYLIVTPVAGGGTGFPLAPREKPVCIVNTFAPDGVTPTVDVPPTDFKTKGDYWLVSDRLKRLFDTLDSDAFSFVEIEMRWSGWKEARTAWLARIVRSFDTRDPDDIPNGAHAFIRSNNLGLPFFDAVLKERSLAECMTGFRFRAVNRF